MSSHETWKSPLDSRYASEKMKRLFSAQTRIEYWRFCWLWLAEAQHELGISDITEEALEDMRNSLTPTAQDFKLAAEEESRTKHDVIAHIRAWSAACPKAAPFIHLGATSCYVTDNGDLLTIRHGFQLLLPKLASCIQILRDFALKHADLPCLSYTHLQPAQVTTVGKRACMWIADLLMDMQNIEKAQDELRFRGAKGTTGTQASFLQIFDGDDGKVDELDKLVTKKAGFKSAYPITGQTYSRKVDVDVVGALAAFGATCVRIGLDIRHLQANDELEEGFDDKNQVGSSAMAYKRNPMKSERMCSLGRTLRNLVNDALSTYSEQIFERTLDDSASRRLTLPHAFLLADSCLRLMDSISRNLTVYPAVIEKRLNEQLPFMATENILVALSKHGKPRAEAHEVLRTISHESRYAMKYHARQNDLLDRIRPNRYFKDIVDSGELDQCTDPRTFYGRAPVQTRTFCGDGGEVAEKLKKYKDTVQAPEKISV